MYHQHVVTLSQRDHFLKEFEFDALCRWVGRETEDHHFRLRIAFTNRPFQLVEEVDAFHQWNRTHLRASNHRPINMNWVARIRHQDGIAVIERRQHQVGQPLFGANGHNRFIFRIDIDLITILIPAGDRPT